MKLIREYIRDLLMEVPLDDFEYLKQDDDDVMVREEVADYFKAIPQSVNIYVAHTDDLSWAHRLPNEIQGKVSGFKSRGQVTLTDISNIGKLYPQIQKEMDPDGINLLYVYPKSFEVPAGGDTFIADVNPHYLAHDLHHMIENAPGRERGEKDAFSSLIKEYLMELVWLSYGGGSMEAEQVRNTLRKTGRRLGVANTNLLMSELFPGIKLPSGDFDLFGDVFADYLKNDGNLVLGVPEQLDYDGTVIELNPDSRHDRRAQQYEKKFKDLFDTVLDPLKGKVAMFNIFEVEHRELERARKKAEEKMQVDHGPLIDLIKAMGGEFRYFDESYKEEGVEELIFDTGLKPEKPVMGVEEFNQRFPKEVESIEALGYKITSAFDGFGKSPVEIRLRKATMKESSLRAYIRSLIVEKELRGKKGKRTLYHIGKRPASPKPAERWGAKGEEGWSRDWIEGPVKSGVFLTPNPTDIAWNHGVSGNVYAYKVPHWVIEKSGGVNRFDTGSEVLISQEVWEEAGDEIEFLGKTMGEDELWDSVDSSYYSAKQKKGVRGAHKHEDGASSISGLRSTNHPEAAIKMMSQEEIKKALTKFEDEYAQEGPAEVVKGPRDRKGLVVPYLGKQPRGKDKELIDLLKKYMNESAVRTYIREALLQKILVEKKQKKKMTSINDVKTVGDLRAVIKYAQLKKQGKEGAKGLAATVTDIVVDEIQGMIPGFATAKNLAMAARNAYKLPDDAKAGALASLDVDDDVSKVLDDAVENQFFDEYLKGLDRLPDDAELEDINVTKALTNWMKKKYNDTIVSKSGD